MRRLGKILFGTLTAAMIGGTVLSANSSICQAAGENPTVGEVYDTALEASYGDTFRSVYENRLAGSPLEAEDADGVDTATGHLMLSRNDLSLDGTGGMDFELNRYYDSNEANLGHATVEYTEKLEVDTVWVNYTASDGSKRRIIVNAAVLKNHKKALKNLLATYEKGEGRRGVSFNGKPAYEEKTSGQKSSATRDITYTELLAAGGMTSHGLRLSHWKKGKTVEKNQNIFTTASQASSILNQKKKQTKTAAVTGSRGWKAMTMTISDWKTGTKP